MIRSKKILLTKNFNFQTVFSAELQKRQINNEVKSNVLEIDSEIESEKESLISDRGTDPA